MTTGILRKNMDAVLNDVKNSALEVIFKYIPKEDCVIFLYGSLAMGKTSSSADIDIGIFCCQTIPFSSMARIRSEIGDQAKTLRDIDVVDFSHIQDINFSKIALKRIKAWHEGQKIKKYFHRFFYKISHAKFSTQ